MKFLSFIQISIIFFVIVHFCESKPIFDDIEDTYGLLERSPKEIFEMIKYGFEQIGKIVDNPSSPSEVRINFLVIYQLLQYYR